MDASLVVALAGLVGGPLVAYFGIVRRASGKIGNSEASQLWEESRAIREWATNRISVLNDVIERLEDKVEELEKAHEECQKDNIKLLRQNSNLEKRVAELEAA